ncbi:MAG: nitroreductase family protein [Anaerolineales bacterium]
MNTLQLEKMEVTHIGLGTMAYPEVLLKRRSIRKYLDKPVEIDLLKIIIRESTLAPSAGNEQPWKFIIVQNPDVLQKISEDCKETLLARIAANPHDYAKKYEHMLQNESFNIFYNAPCLVLILGKRDVKNLLFDCTLAASYFMMSAAAKGLGTCWINFARELKKPALLEQIGVPANHTIIAPIIVGYPAIVPPPPKRKTIPILKITND